MQINELNNDCLILVLSQFTLQQLVCLRIVCKRWQSVIELLCHKKASLQLFASVEDGQSYWQFAKRHNSESFEVIKYGQGGNQLILSGARDDPHFPAILLSIFPKVKKVVVRVRCPQLIVALLECWREYLENLCLYMFSCEDEEEEKQIWCLLNSMPKLKRLHLFLYSASIIEPIPVLARLENFSLSYFFGDITVILSKLSHNIRRLYLNYISCDLDQLRRLLCVCPQITSHLTHLTVVNIRSNASSLDDRKLFFRLICKHFVSLTHLDITFTNQISLFELLSDLTQLRHLTELKLQVSSILPESNRTSPVPTRPTSFPSITTLYLSFCKPYDGTHLANFDRIPVIFPRVEELFIQCNDPDLCRSLDSHLSQFKHLRKHRLI